MTDIEKRLIREKWKIKNLEIEEIEEQLKKQYDEIHELMKTLGKRPKLRRQANSMLYTNIIVRPNAKN
jgi:hypothetical protein